MLRRGEEIASPTNVSRFIKLWLTCHAMINLVSGAPFADREAPDRIDGHIARQQLVIARY